MFLVQAPHNHQKYAFTNISLSSGNNSLPDAKAGLSCGCSQSRSRCRLLVSADTPPRTSVFAFVLSWPFWCGVGGFCLLSNTVWGLAFCFSKVFNLNFSPKKFQQSAEIWKRKPAYPSCLQCGHTTSQHSAGVALCLAQPCFPASRLLPQCSAIPRENAVAYVQFA